MILEKNVAFIAVQYDNRINYFRLPIHSRYGQLTGRCPCGNVRRIHCYTRKWHAWLWQLCTRVCCESKLRGEDMWNYDVWRMISAMQPPLCHTHSSLVMSLQNALIIVENFAAVVIRVIRPCTLIGGCRDFPSEHTASIFRWPVKTDPECSSKIFITLYQIILCPNADRIMNSHHKRKKY
jgi:hypothetical protein